MTGYVVRRILLMVPVAVGVTVIVFFMIHLVPGDPARNFLGTRATPEAIEALHQEWGLDRSLFTQYRLFMGRLAGGDLGNSFFFRAPVGTLVSQRLLPTIGVLAAGTLFSALLSVPLAAIAASRRGGIRDHLVRIVPLVGLGFPSFWVGIVLLILVALPSDGLIPVGGWGEGLSGHLRSLLLPGLAIAFAISPMLIRSLRVGLLEVMESDHVMAARSKGLSRWHMLVRHELRNAAAPTIAILGVNVAFLVGNTVVIENVFAIPGLGALMIDAIDSRDYPLVQGIALVFAGMVMLVYLVTDILHAVIDPRVRAG